MKRIIALTLSIVLAACSRGEDEAPDARPTGPPPNYASLRVIGNSLTRHPPVKDLGWAGDWGMAASSADKDFAHLTAAALGVPLTAITISGLEYDFDTYVPHIPDVTGGIDAQTAVVVELGDNAVVAQVVEFEVAYGKLLDATKGAARLICTSTWWKNKSLDDAMNRQCRAHGGYFVRIGDLYKGRLGIYAHQGVDKHPGDVAMAEIATRVTAVFQE